jgi:hypothetical protein
MTWEHKGIYWELAGHNYSNSPWIYEAETGYVVEGTLTPTKGFKGVTKASLTRAKNYAERQLSKYKISNPSPPKNKWLPVSAVKFNQNGSVSMRGSKVSNPKRKKRNPTRDWDYIVNTIDSPIQAGRELGALWNRIRLGPSREYFLTFLRAWSKKHGVSSSEVEAEIQKGVKEVYRPMR